MSKRFKGKTCVYCGVENSSQTGDHIFAREFFLSDKRDNLPQVPACDTCNNEKSKLEHYLTAVLPFGAQHSDAAANLADMVPRRLAKNARLHRHLAQKTESAWVKENGILSRQTTVPIDSTKIEQLFCYVIKGLMWHHWQVIFTTEHFVTAGTLTFTGEQFFWNLFNMNANKRVNETLGEGTFQYEGVQGFGSPHVSVWKITVYGGLKLGGDPQVPGEKSSLIWGLTCRNSLKDKVFGESKPAMQMAGFGDWL